MKCWQYIITKRSDLRKNTQKKELRTRKTAKVDAGKV